MVAALGLVVLASVITPPAAQAQTPAPAASQATPPPPPTWRWNLINLTRVESWHFFEPPATGGNPDYTFIANRLRVALTGTWKRFDLSTAAQYVQFGGLPPKAVGPGPLGTGALYYQHASRTDSYGAYVRALSLRARLPHGVTLQGGRFGYTSGSEAPSGRPKIEAVKRARVDSRMIGEFEWSLYQRTFDGLRGDVDRKAWHVTGTWLRPTQGGFEEHAGASLSGIDVLAGTVALRPDVALPKTDLSIFAYHYDDDRQVAARPDNSGRTASRVDVGITTLGAAAVGTAPAGRGDFDWLAWFAGQTGSWYGQNHQAWSLVLETGYQWKARWQPWIRVGFLDASGDGSPSDDRHNTFFPMLPTVRKYSMTTAYATMNLRDLFAESIVRPTAKITARAAIRRLWLANGGDLWYAGSGATQNTGTSFGYAGRRSGGTTDLASAVIEGAVDVTLARHWSANAFLGVIHGGQVVAASFPGRWLRFFYLENVVQW
ncbi:MAG: alginate export family protein [Acidobacteriota bacterium]|nr:alginate export family protein [Acidobacteriota bacterium]